jgi:hypothetical protein
MHAIGAEMTRLAASALRRHAPYVGDAAFLSAAEPFFESLIERASSQGLVDEFRVQGRLAGIFLTWHEPDSPLGVPITPGMLHLDAGSPAARSWAEKLVAARRASLPDDFLLELDASYRALLPHLFGCGYGVESVALGQTVQGVRRALETVGPRELPAGFSLRELATEGDIDVVIQLQREAYTKTPEFCPHGATEGNLATVRQGMEDGIERGWPQLVLLEAGTVVGYIGATIIDANPYWGRTAVGDIVFSEHIRGRGLLGPCSLQLLARLAASDVRTLLGPTAQPPVMRMAERFDARPVAWMVRKSSPFDPSHFNLG